MHGFMLRSNIFLMVQVGRNSTAHPVRFLFYGIMTKSEPADLESTQVRSEIRRSRLLMVSYCFAPNGTMEERNGWQRAVSAAKDFDVTLLYFPSVSVSELESHVPSDIRPGGLNLVPVSEGWLSRSLSPIEALFYVRYRHWHRLAYRAAAKLHSEDPFSISHLVTLCGFREPGFVWQLNIPHVWGPIGGTHYFPMRFLKSLDMWNQCREIVRTFLNHYQLHWCSRVRTAMQRSVAVVAATSDAQIALRKAFGISAEVELETGIDYPVASPRQIRSEDAPFRILWAGRLRAWKGLPLLLHAIAKLPKSLPIELRVLGDGRSKKSWQKLAQRLGIAENIEWIPWPSYRETLPYYGWADAFAFTSLRDTSGTGLLESLAAGCPIIGMNHQGAFDIMTDQCAIRIRPTEWPATVDGFRDGIESLARDARKHLCLSHGALERAREFEWRTRASCFPSIYQRVLKQVNFIDAIVSLEAMTDIEATSSARLDMANS